MSKIKRTGKIKLKTQFGNKPLRKKNKKKSKKILEGYYIDDKGLKMLYKDEWGST